MIAVAELDIHPTIGGEFAVFHARAFDRRTNGTGVTREAAMSTLKSLDIGYGYTADGGKTFPFRGKGGGLMPTLDEVLAAFSTGRKDTPAASRRTVSTSSRRSSAAERRADLRLLRGGSRQSLRRLDWQ